MVTAESYPNAMFSSCKSQFAEKKHPIIQFKNKGKFQTFSSKSGRSRLREVNALQEVPNTVI